MKKIMFFILVSIAFMIKANALEQASFKKVEVIDGVFVTKEIEGKTTSQQAQIMRRISDNMHAYCVEPGELISSSAKYNSYNYDDFAKLGISDSIFKKVNLYAYYGYAYTGHEEEKWYMVTQILIWRAIRPNSEFYFVDKINGKKINTYDKEINELEELVNKHKTLPSFNEENHELTVGEQYTLKDENGVLNRFIIEKIDGVNIETTDELMTVSVDKVGHYNIKMNSKARNLNNGVIIYINEDYQNIITGSTISLIDGGINLNVNADVILKKIEKGTNKKLNIPNIEFKIFDVNNEKYILNNNSEIFKTNEKGEIIVSLPKGKYSIEEVLPPKGYLKAEDPYILIIDENSKFVFSEEHGNVIIVEFENEFIEFKIPPTFKNKSYIIEVLILFCVFILWRTPYEKNNSN